MTVGALMGILWTANSSFASAHEPTYTVKSGDTLWRISQGQDVTVKNLIDWNHLSPNTLKVGQVISLDPPTANTSYIFYTVKSGDSLSVIAKTYNTNISELQSINKISSYTIRIGQVLKVPSNSNVSSVTSSQTNTYTVKSGDSLSVIAKKNNTNVASIQSLNGLTSDVIRIGQVLTIPSSVQKQSFDVDALIAEAKTFIGVPYVYGGSIPSGFDCSGFLNYIFNKEGVQIPRTVETEWTATTSVTHPEKGDLVFFNTDGTGAVTATHVGLYIGNNEFIHASTSQGVTISSLTNVYWKACYLGARKLN